MRITTCGLVLALAATGSAAADDTKADLAKQLSNPVAPLTVLPFQFNYDRGYGPDKGDQLQLNV
ncbi:MAG: transporter, partial [Martelella sp.]